MLASGKHPSRESAPPLPPFYGLLNELPALFYIDDPTRPISIPLSSPPSRAPLSPIYERPYYLLVPLPDFPN